jgi:hypothetical protein
MKKFGKALDIDSSLIGNEIKSENLLSYMGMIEQKICEISLANGLNSNHQ